MKTVESAQRFLLRRHLHLCYPHGLTLRTQDDSGGDNRPEWDEQLVQFCVGK